MASMMKGMSKFASRGRYQAPADFDVKKSVDNDTAARMAQPSRHPLHKMHQAGIRTMPLSSKMKMIVSFLLPAFTAVVFPVAVASRRLRGRTWGRPGENSTIPGSKKDEHEVVYSTSSLLIPEIAKRRTQAPLMREESWESSFQICRDQKPKKKGAHFPQAAAGSMTSLLDKISPDATPKAATATPEPDLSLEHFVRSVKEAQKWARPFDPAIKEDNLGKQFFLPDFGKHPPSKFGVGHHLTARCEICECITHLSKYLCTLNVNSREYVVLTKALYEFMNQVWVRNAWKKMTAWRAEEQLKNDKNGKGKDPYDTMMFAYHALLWAPGNLVLGKDKEWTDSGKEIESGTEDDRFRKELQVETGRIQLPLPEETTIEKIYGKAAVDLHHDIWEMVVQSHWTDDRAEKVQERLRNLPPHANHAIRFAELVRKRSLASKEKNDLAASIAKHPAFSHLHSLKFVETMTKLSKLRIKASYACEIGWACGLGPDSYGWDGELGEEVTWSKVGTKGQCWKVAKSTSIVVQEAVKKSDGRKVLENVQKSFRNKIPVPGGERTVLVQPPVHLRKSYMDRISKGDVMFPKLSIHEPLNFLVGTVCGTHVQTPAARGASSCMGTKDRPPRPSLPSFQGTTKTRASPSAPNSPTRRFSLWNTVRETFLPNTGNHAYEKGSPTSFGPSSSPCHSVIFPAFSNRL